MTDCIKWCFSDHTVCIRNEHVHVSWKIYVKYREPIKGIECIKHMQVQFTPTKCFLFSFCFASFLLNVEQVNGEFTGLYCKSHTCSQTALFLLQSGNQCWHACVSNLKLHLNYVCSFLQWFSQDACEIKCVHNKIFKIHVQIKNSLIYSSPGDSLPWKRLTYLNFSTCTSSTARCYAFIPDKRTRAFL